MGDFPLLVENVGGFAFHEEALVFGLRRLNIAGRDLFFHQLFGLAGGLGAEEGVDGLVGGLVKEFLVVEILESFEGLGFETRLHRIIKI